MRRQDKCPYCKKMSPTTWRDNGSGVYDCPNGHRWTRDGIYALNCLERARVKIKKLEAEVAQLKEKISHEMDST